MILAAKHKSLQCYLADKINAKIVMEVANGGISPCAYKILVGRNKLVIPDIVLNAPYSITSYFEYLRDMEGISFGEIVKKYVWVYQPFYTKSIIIVNIIFRYSSKFVQDVLSSNDNEEQVIFNSMKCILNNMLKVSFEILAYTSKIVIVSFLFFNFRRFNITVDDTN